MAASSPAAGTALKDGQRLHYLLASLESSDAADRALFLARELLSGLPGPQARHGLLEVLRGELRARAGGL